MAYLAMIEAARAAVGRAVAAAGLGAAAAESAPYAVAPARRGFGDLSCNAAFVLAGSARRRPADIAAELAAAYNRLAADGGGGGGGGPRSPPMRASAHPSGYVNLEARGGALAEYVVAESLRDGYGGGGHAGRRQRVVVEHTSVNPNKALHIGHVRNVAIGDSVARILAYAGHDVSALNYVDDSGAQVADVVVGFMHLGFAQEPPAGSAFDAYCGDEVYVATTERYESDPGLAERRAEVLRDIERGGTEAARLAESVTERVLECQLRTCWRLGASYDCLNYESQMVRSGMWAGAFEAMKAGGTIELEAESAGKNARCWVFRAGEGGGKFSGDKVVVRSDGTATYIAKDIPYAAWKLGRIGDPFAYEEYEAAGGRRQPGGRRLVRTVLRAEGGARGAGPSPFSGARSIAVIDSRQSRLQRIVSEIVGKIGGGGEGGAPAHAHLSYEAVTLSAATAGSLGRNTGGRAVQMSGRRGLYVSADAVMDMLEGRAGAETRRRNADLGADEVARIAGAVAVATIRYEMVKQDLDKAITFDVARSLSLEGDTASYIQYAYARAARVAERAGAGHDLGSADFGQLGGEREMALVRLIGMFDVRVAEAADNLAPKVVARYCRELAVSFNDFYEHVRVIDASNGALSNTRLCLVASFMSTLGKALGLIGIDAPARM